MPRSSLYPLLVPILSAAAVSVLLLVTMAGAAIHIENVAVVLVASDAGECGTASTGQRRMDISLREPRGASSDRCRHLHDRSPGASRYFGHSMYLGELVEIRVGVRREEPTPCVHTCDRRERQCDARRGSSRHL